MKPANFVVMIFRLQYNPATRDQTDVSRIQPYVRVRRRVSRGRLRPCLLCAHDFQPIPCSLTDRPCRAQDMVFRPRPRDARPAVPDLSRPCELDAGIEEVV